MSLTPRPSANFNQDAFNFILDGEEFRPQVDGDPVGVPRIGVGYALVVKNGNRWLPPNGV